MEKSTIHPAVKVLTATMFFVLMLGFVAFRSGAFDGSPAAQIKLNVSRTGVSHNHKSKSNTQYTRRAKSAEDNSSSSIAPLKMGNMAASSKVIISTPVNWSGFLYPEYAAMAGSKSAAVVTTPASSAYGGIFTTPYWWKAESQSKGAQLKQGRK